MESEPARRHPAPEGDWAARLLEGGLCAVIVAAPLPFGAVTPSGRLALELASFALGIVWIVRALTRPTPLPPRLACIGALGMLALALLQAAPLGAGVLSPVSPRSIELRRASAPVGDALEGERRILGADPSTLDPPAALSVAPQATASALRTGAALVLLLLVASTVAAARGIRGLALALLVSAAFQGLYGTLVLASGYDRIWNVPKVHYLDSATGTFINKNHFAGYLAMALPAGFALVLSRVARARAARARVVDLFGPEGVRTLLAGVLVVLGAIGLLLSMSRAGIALALLALVLTAAAAGRRGVRLPLVAAVIAIGLALVPLLQLGSEKLAERYVQSAEDLSSPGGRAEVWRDTLSIAAAFPLAGSGYGTFESVYPLFRSPSVRTFYSHAHNDALQAVAEGGLAGAVLLLLVVVPVGRRVLSALTGQEGIVAAGIAAGLLAVLLHALIDFNFHIPSNAATAAVLAGALLGLPWRARA